MAGGGLGISKGISGSGFGGFGRGDACEGVPDSKTAARDAAMGQAWCKFEEASHTAGRAVAGEGNSADTAAPVVGRAAA